MRLRAAQLDERPNELPNTFRDVVERRRRVNDAHAIGLARRNFKKRRADRFKIISRNIAQMKAWEAEGK